MSEMKACDLFIEWNEVLDRDAPFRSRYRTDEIGGGEGEGPPIALVKRPNCSSTHMEHMKEPLVDIETSLVSKSSRRRSDAAIDVFQPRLYMKDAENVEKQYRRANWACRSTILTRHL